MKQPKSKPTRELDESLREYYKANSQRLHQIAAHVYEFAEDDDDDTVNCVLRILEKYHSAKAEVYELLKTRK
jgi:hypothetical protein